MKNNQDDEVYEEVQEEQVEGVGSQEGEETQEQPGYSEKIERPELPPPCTPEERYGNLFVSISRKRVFETERVDFQLAQCSSCLREKRQPNYTTIS